MMPSVGFGNQPCSGMERPHTVSNDGVPAVGTWDDLQVLLVRETAMHHYNMQRMIGLTPVFPKDLYYTNLRGERVPVQLPFDPEGDHEYVSFMRQIYGHLKRTAAFYNLEMSKSIFKANQRKIMERYQDLTDLSREHREGEGEQAAVARHGGRGSTRWVKPWWCRVGGGRGRERG